MNRGKRNFVELSSSESGINVSGVVRDIQNIKTNNGDVLLFLRNDDYPVHYRKGR